MSVEEPESGSDSAELLSGYLDYFRAVVIGKLDRLSDTELRHSRLPSGWTPMELLKHLIFMERRWFQWGLMAERVDQPWADGLERWQVTDDDTLATLTGLLTEVSSRTREILAGWTWPRRPRSVAGSSAPTRRRPGCGSVCTSCRSTPVMPAISTSSVS